MKWFKLFLDSSLDKDEKEKEVQKIIDARELSPIRSHDLKIIEGLIFD